MYYLLSIWNPFLVATTGYPYNLKFILRLVSLCMRIMPHQILWICSLILVGVIYEPTKNVRGWHIKVNSRLLLPGDKLYPLGVKKALNFHRGFDN